VADSDNAMARHAGGPVCYLKRFTTGGAVAYEHWVRSARTLPRGRDVLAVGDESSQAVCLDSSKARTP